MKQWLECLWWSLKDDAALRHFVFVFAPIFGGAVAYVIAELGLGILAALIALVVVWFAGWIFCFLLEQ